MCGGAAANNIYAACDSFGCGFLSKLEPFGAASAVETSAASSSSSSNGAWPAWSIGTVVACGVVVVAVVAGVVVHKQRAEALRERNELTQQLAEDGMLHQALPYSDIDRIVSQHHCLQPPLPRRLDAHIHHLCENGDESES